MCIGLRISESCFLKNGLARRRRNSPMRTECSTDGDLFGAVEGRRVVSEFDGGAITSDAGGLLLRAADRAIGLIAGFAACFADQRLPGLIEHGVATLVGQRVFAIAL